MKKDVIESLLANSRLQRDRAKKMLDEHYDDLEENNQETFWLNLYITHKKAVEWLESLTPDDE